MGLGIWHKLGGQWQSVVSAHELHGMLAITEPLDQWLAPWLATYIEWLEYEPIVVKQPDGRTTRDYLLSRPIVETLALAAPTDVGHCIREFYRAGMRAREAARGEELGGWMHGFLDGRPLPIDRDEHPHD